MNRTNSQAHFCRNKDYNLNSYKPTVKLGKITVDAVSFLKKQAKGKIRSSA